jgi:16S rRNA (guanine966-N2)-methyltransferase
VFAALRGSIREHVDVIFMDPPYNQEYEKRVLEILKDASYVDEDTLIVVEASKETSLDYAENLGYTIEKEKVYKTNKHVFIKKI